VTKLLTVCLLAALLITAASPTRAQQPPAAPKPAMVPLDVDVVISRYQADRKISSVPYTLNVNANGDQTTLAMSTEVPVPSTTVAPVAQNGQSQAPVRNYNYRNVGTNIVLRASSAGDGVFQLQVNLDDSSVFSPDGRQQAVPLMPDVPAFRSFKGVNTLLLKDGQTRQYTVATDRVTGEVLKVDVTLKVLK
jgi:hypothetical protein